MTWIFLLVYFFFNKYCFLWLQWNKALLLALTPRNVFSVHRSSMALAMKLKLDLMFAEHPYLPNVSFWKKLWLSLGGLFFRWGVTAALSIVTLQILCSASCRGSYLCSLSVGWPISSKQGGEWTQPVFMLKCVFTSFAGIVSLKLFIRTTW